MKYSHVELPNLCDPDDYSRLRDEAEAVGIDFEHSQDGRFVIWTDDADAACRFSLRCLAEFGPDPKKVAV